MGTNGADPLNNLVSQYTFSSTDFTFVNPGSSSLQSVENFATVLKSAIPISDFNPPSDNIAPVADIATASSLYELRNVQIQLNSSFPSPSLTISNKFLADGFAGSNEIARVIAINVRPHIVNYYFEKDDGSQTTSQIQGANAEGVNLVLKVKDYNGCANMTSGAVTADLAQLGLPVATPLDFVSCDADGKTATFKKMSVTTETTL